MGGGGVESGAENGGKGGIRAGSGDCQFCLPSLEEEDYLEHH